MLQRFKRAQRDYQQFKSSPQDEGFLEFYLKRVAKDRTKFLLALMLLAASAWLFYDLRRILVLFYLVMGVSAILLIWDALSQKR